MSNKYISAGVKGPSGPRGPSDKHARKRPNGMSGEVSDIRSKWYDDAVKNDKRSREELLAHIDRMGDCILNKEELNGQLQNRHADRADELIRLKSDMKNMKKKVDELEKMKLENEKETTDLKTKLTSVSIKTNNYDVKMKGMVL